jgi:hypothetical protein
MCDDVRLTAAEADWICDAVCALHDLSVTDDDDEARGVLERARLPGCATDPAHIWEMTRDELRTQLLVSVRCLLATDPADADALAREYGRPDPLPPNV